MYYMDFMKPKKKKMTLDDLAVMVAEGFNEIHEKMSTKDDIVAIRAEMATKDDIVAIRAEMATKDDIVAIRAKMATKDDIKDLKKDIQLLQFGQENIQLRLDSMAPNFEVKTLRTRVERLEQKVGIKN